MTIVGSFVGTCVRIPQVCIRMPARLTYLCPQAGRVCRFLHGGVYSQYIHIYITYHMYINVRQDSREGFLYGGFVRSRTGLARHCMNQNVSRFGGKSQGDVLLRGLFG
jgi:hypothetical protein